jgi:hypothetical protein
MAHSPLILDELPGFSRGAKPEITAAALRADLLTSENYGRWCEIARVSKTKSNNNRRNAIAQRLKTQGITDVKFAQRTLDGTLVIFARRG